MLGRITHTMRHLALHIRLLVTALAFIPLLVLVGCAPNYGTNFNPPPKLLYRLSGHGFWVESVSWSPGGKLLASASTDMSVRIWDVASRQTIHQLTFPGSGKVVAWSPDDKYLATISDEPGDFLKIWGTTTWNMAAHMDPGKDANFATEPGGMAWSPDSKYLAVSANGYPNKDIGRIKVYDASNWQVALVADAPDGAQELTWSLDGVSILFGTSVELPVGTEAELNIWNTHTNSVTKLTDPDQADYGLIALSPDGQYVAGASEMDNDIAIWDVNAEQKVQSLKGHSDTVTSIVWSPDSSKLASGSLDKTARIWDAASGQALESFKHSDGVFDVAWSPDGKTLATACADSLVYIWDAK
jgi:WD40 repeat protein